MPGGCHPSGRRLIGFQSQAFVVCPDIGRYKKSRGSLFKGDPLVFKKNDLENRTVRYKAGVRGIYSCGLKVEMVPRRCLQMRNDWEKISRAIFDLRF